MPLELETRERALGRGRTIGAVIREDDVLPSPADDAVNPDAAKEKIVPGPGEDRVVVTDTGLHGARLFEHAARKLNCAHVAEDDVAAPARIDGVVPRPAHDEIVARPC